MPMFLCKGKTKNIILKLSHFTLSEKLTQGSALVKKKKLEQEFLGRGKHTV